MKPTFKKLEVPDLSNLEKLVAENIEGIEPGLRVIDARLCLGQAAIDLVALDAEKRWCSSLSTSLRTKVSSCESWTRTPGAASTPIRSDASIRWRMCQRHARPESCSSLSA